MRWVVFSVVAAVFFGLAWGALDMGWNEAAGVLGIVTGIFGLAALAEFVIRYAEVMAGIFERRQTALNRTSLVMVSEALKYLHPENSKLLDKFIARTVWDVDIQIKTGERDWMLRGTDVHFGFIEYVLDHSGNGKLCGRNQFAEGSKKWDPHSITEDREQHRQFEEWLASRLIVVRQYGENHPAMFMPPWNPQALKKLMGFDGPVDLYKADEVEKVAGLRDLNAISQ